MIALALTWTNTDMSNLNLALIALFVFCLLMFAFVQVALPKINIIKLKNIKLNDKLADEVFIRVLIACFSIFMLIFFISNDLFYILLSQLMTLKISRGFTLYQKWLADQNSHNWKHLFLCLLFYIVKPK